VVGKVNYYLYCYLLLYTDRLSDACAFILFKRFCIAIVSRKYCCLDRRLRIMNVAAHWCCVSVTSKFYTVLHASVSVSVVELLIGVFKAFCVHVYTSLNENIEVAAKLCRTYIYYRAYAGRRRILLGVVFAVSRSLQKVNERINHTHLSTVTTNIPQLIASSLVVIIYSRNFMTAK